MTVDTTVLKWHSSSPEETDHLLKNKLFIQYSITPKTNIALRFKKEKC
jgi:hypothetical protein